jgi:hypothetical protein
MWIKIDFRDGIGKHLGIVTCFEKEDVRLIVGKKAVNLAGWLAGGHLKTA